MLARQALSTACAAMAAALCLLSQPARSNTEESVAKFYQGRTITILTGFPGSSTYGVASRIMAKYFTQYMPGNPVVVPQFMPGAGSIKAINFLYNAAPKDGTYIGIGIPGLAMNQLIMKQGIHFDMRHFHYIGRLVDGNVVFMIRSDVPGGPTLESMRKNQVVTGGSGKGTHTYIYPTIMNALLGTRFKVVLGYPSNTEQYLALEQKEIYGMTGSWLTWKHEKPDWLRDRYVTPLVEIGMNKEPGLPGVPDDLPGVPLLKDLAKTPEDKAILEFLSSPMQVGRAVVAPPGVPPDRVEALRRAFDKTMADAQFQAEMEKVKHPLNPAKGEVIQAAVLKTLALPPELVTRATTLLKFD